MQHTERGYQELIKLSNVEQVKMLNMSNCCYNDRLKFNYYSVTQVVKILTTLNLLWKN